MTISGINSNASLYQSSGIDSTSQTGNSSIPPPMMSGTSGAAGSASISKPGELMSKLSSLATSDPAKFKEVAGSIATELQSEAKNAQGGAASFLSTLANKFTQASQTGSMSSLAPSQGQGGPPPGGGAGGAQGHHHHHHGGGGGGSGGSSAVTDALSAALDQVNTALNGTSSTTSATSSTSTTSSTSSSS